MSNAEDRYRAAIATMETAAREQDEQRGLRERRVAQAEAQAREGMRQEFGAAQKYAEHMDELAKRKQSAGGWATEKSMADKGREVVMEFGVEDEGSERTVSHPYPGSAAARPEPEPEPVEAPKRGRHARPVDDEDDYSSTSWLV